MDSATVVRRYVGVTASAAAAGMKRSRETAFIEADTLLLSEQFVHVRRSYRPTEAEPTRGRSRRLGITMTTQNTRERQ